MCLDRRIGLVFLAALTLAGCGGQSATDAERPTYDYLAAVRPLAYENARTACAGHSFTSLAYEYETNGGTVGAAARSWARSNQPDLRLRDVSYRGCRDGLQTGEPAAGQTARLTTEEIEIYVVAYSTCRGLTVADLVQEYGLDTGSLTVEEAVRAMVRKTYVARYRATAYGACVAALHGEAPRYGS